MDVNYTRTGIDGVACVGCSVNNAAKVLDTDITNYATINIPINAIGAAGLSVKNGFEEYPTNTFVGFDISNNNLLNFNFLGSLSIQLYKNNILVQTGTGISQLLNANSSLLTGSNRGIIGIVSNVAFDEARILIGNIVSLQLGNTNVYRMVLQRGCPGILTCLTSAELKSPNYSVVIENSRTGLNSGVACVACEVSDANKSTNADLTDYARINLSGGVLGTNGSISVRDLSIVYPIGTIAGFVVRDPNPLIQGGILSSTTISTYLNGTLQESNSGDAQLLDFNALLPWLGSGSQKRALGFPTTKPFNEIRVTYTTLLGQAFAYLDVYNAFIDARSAYDDGSGFNCRTLIQAINDTSNTYSTISVNGFAIPNDKGNGKKIKSARYLDNSLTWIDAQPLTDTFNVYDLNGVYAGKFTIDSNGNYNFVSVFDYAGSVPVDYTLKDQWGFTSNARIILNVSYYNPLPIELLSFDGYFIDNKNVLNWTTASEVNTSHFEIEKSLDGIEWTKKGNKTAVGGKYTQTDYSFDDEMPSVGNNYYRLKAVDFDGSSNYSSIIKIKVAETIDESTIKIFPNPTTGTLNLWLNAHQSQDGSIRITDILGNQIQVVQKKIQIGVNQFIFDLRYLSSGTYIISYLDNQGNKQYSKFIKE